MYLPTHFEETDTVRLHQFIREQSFGALVTVTPAGLDANHIPFVLSDVQARYGTLRGHVARANPVWREVRDDSDALVIFQGAHAYVSPSWYASKDESGRVVPTWNYLVVHAHGPLRIIDDAGWLRAHVEELTREHEGRRADPWAVSDAPSDFIAKLVDAIVGVELPIARLIGKWKVSQNRSARDRAGVVAGLRGERPESSLEVADSVEKTLRHDPGR